MDLDPLIPHRGRWKIIDQLIEIEGARAIAEATFDEEFVEGHFPEQPVVPGVILLEGLAQTMLALCAVIDPDLKGTPFLAGFDRVRFRSPVFPPATVRFEIKITGQRAMLTSASGVATWEGKRVCTAKLTGAVLPSP